MKGFSFSSKAMGIILGSFIVVAVAVGVFLYTNDPKIKFMHLINKEYKALVSVLDQAKESELAILSKDNPVTSTGNISFDLTLDEALFGESMNGMISAINDLEIKYQYGSDPINSNTYVKLDSSIDTKDFIDIELYQMKDKKYIYLNSIYDKYIESSSSDFIATENTQTDDAIYLVNKIKSSFILALHSSDFKTVSQNIEVNKGSVATNKITLKLTDKRLKEITKTVLYDLKADARCLKIINNLGGEEEKSTTSIDDMIKSLDTDTMLTQDLTLDMYIKDNEIVKLDVFSGPTKKIQYLNYVGYNPTKEITLMNGEDIILIAVFETVSQNDIKYKISLSGTEMIVNGTISKIITKATDNKTWDLDMSFTLGLTNGNSTLGSIKISTQTTTKVGGEVKMIDITNTIKEEDMTEEEQNSITSKLLEKVFSALSISMSTPGSTDEEEEIY